MRSAEIDIGHVGYVGGFLAEVAAPARELAGARMRDGDLVGAVAAAREGGLSDARARALERGLRHRGSALAELRADAPAASVRALEDLSALGPLLEAAGVGGAFRYDLGFVPSFAYYSGVVFQVTVPGLGFALAAGGRYDGLLARFGADRPATGFGIAVPHLHQAIVGEGWAVRDEAPLLVLAPASDDVATLRVATALRGAGIAVAIGDVAETAGRAVVRAAVVDERNVEFEGARHSVDALVAALRR